MAEQSDMQQSEASPSTASLNSFLERDFERSLSATVTLEKARAAISSASVATEQTRQPERYFRAPSGHFERHCGYGAGPSATVATEQA